MTVRELMAALSNLDPDMPVSFDDVEIDQEQGLVTSFFLSAVGVQVVCRENGSYLAVIETDGEIMATETREARS